MASPKNLPHPNFRNFESHHSVHVHISADNNAVCYRYDEETDSRIHLRPTISKGILEMLGLIFTETMVMESDDMCRVIFHLVDGAYCLKRRSLHYRPEWGEDCYFCHFEQEKGKPTIPPYV
jgi:hypothetical protein